MSLLTALLAFAPVAIAARLKPTEREAELQRENDALRGRISQLQAEVFDAEVRHELAERRVERIQHELYVVARERVEERQTALYAAQPQYFQAQQLAQQNMQAQAQQLQQQNYHHQQRINAQNFPEMWHDCTCVPQRHDALRLGMLG